MWKKGIRPARLLYRSRSYGIQPCRHPFREQLANSVSPSIIVRNTWNWTKIKPDPKNPFFAKRSTKNTPQTAGILLRNAGIPMLQLRPPVFYPSTSDQVQHSLNIMLFMSDFNVEPSPLALNVLACSSTGLIHYIQVANQFFSLIMPTYNITNCGKTPELIPPLLKTFLESASYIKVGYGAYEDTRRIADQYGIVPKNIVDIYWMTKTMGVGSTNVGMLHDAFSDIHDVYIPGRVNPDGSFSNPGQSGGRIIDPRRWDWESLGSNELPRELTRCIAQDAFATLHLYNNIQEQKFKLGYQPPLTEPSRAISHAKDFLLTSLPPGALIPIRSIHQLLKGPLMRTVASDVDRDAQALALVRLLIESMELVTDRADTTHVTFRDPSVLNRRVALPGVRSSETLLNNSYSKKVLTEVFGCRADELRLMQDSDMTRKPEKIQDLECFLGVYEWLEFLPGAELDDLTDGSSPLKCGRKEATLLAMFLNFGTIAEKARINPVETKQWVSQRVESLVRRGVLLRTDDSQRVIRIKFKSDLLLIKKLDQIRSS
ncbi:hypothetical protein BGZ76_004828 [Entomortierella beljakovae]|nr:hypothetical protein BGZ76_004828 [Entomortierella beljakovae]